MNKPLAKYYQQDFYDWINQNVALLKTKKFAELDINNLIEEMEALGRAEKRSLTSHIAVLIHHLLKWQFQPKKRCKSWRVTIKQQRYDIKDRLKESPSLKNQLPIIVASAFIRGRNEAIDETGLSVKSLPKENPYTVAQLMDEQFFPN